MNNMSQIPSAVSRKAFLSLGFRPFYLAGSLYAAVSMLVWIAYLFDLMELSGPMDGVLWHSHELIFGFAVAILVGFLFTAVRNWTRLPTPSGLLLAALLGLWLCGRLHSIFGWGIIGTLLDLAFLPACAIAIGIPLVRSGNRRNYFAPFLMGVLTVANLAFYAIAYGYLAFDETLVFLVAVDVFAIFITIIGGRIIPLFSNNATGSKRAQRHQALEHVIVGGMVLLLVTDGLFGLSNDGALWRVLLLCLLCLLHLVKMAAWRPQITRIDPILWILPLSYLWLPIALGLRAASLAGAPFDQLLGLHAMTAGAMGSMMLAMMTRSALGHTGRKITAGKIETSIYLLITLGAAVRVFGPLIKPEFYLIEIAASGLCWMVAFTLFAGRFLPILTRPRL